MNVSEQIIIALPILFFSMALHEMMHAYASYRLGDDTAYHAGRVSINPLRHIDPFLTIALPLGLILTGSPFIFGAAKPVMVNFPRIRYGELGGAIVGMIGPLTNLLLAALAALLFRAIEPAYGTMTYDVFKLVIAINVGFFVFNSIPWPPLDGSRLLYAFAPRPLQEFMESIERLGFMSLILFIFLFYSIFGSAVGNIIGDVIHLLAPSLVL